MERFIWSLDKQHSSIVFRVKHMLISTVTGRIQQFNVHVENDTEDFQGASIRCEIDVNSITTGDTYRDSHLKSDVLFDVSRFPAICFRSGEFVRSGEDTYEMTGDLTMKDTTRTLHIPVRHLGTNTVDAVNRASFEADFTICRDQFHLNYNPLLEKGGMIIAREVNIETYFTLIEQ